MYKYQNVSDIEQSITRDGDISPRIVPAGGEVTSSVIIENPNFKFITTVEPKSASIVGVETPQSGVVTDPLPVDNDQTNKENE